MTLETILNILYANGYENVIVLATRIDNDIPFEHKNGNTVVIEVHKTDLPSGLQFENDKAYGFVPAQIIGFNKYKIDTPYLIVKPDGSSKWFGHNQFKDQILTQVVTIPVSKNPVTP